MTNEVSLLRDILLLKDAAFARFRALPQALEYGLVLVICVSLLVGLANSVEGLVNHLSVDPQAREEAKREARQELRDRVRAGQMPAYMADLIWDYAGPGIDMGFDIAGLPTPLGQPASAIMAWTGRLVSIPLRRLASWAFYSALILLFAKWMGGIADLRTMLGCTALSLLPRLLNVLGPIPWLGGMASLVAWAWALVILVKATAVANGFSLTRGLLAVLMPWLILLAFLLIISPAFLIGLISLASQLMGS